MTGFGGASPYGLLSSLGAANANNFSIEANRNAAGNLYGAWGEGGSFGTLATVAQGSGNGHVIVNRSSGTSLEAYRDGSLLNTSTTSVTPLTSSANWLVFAHGTAGPLILNYAAARSGGYSIGASLSEPEVVAFNVAMQAFQTALGRNV